MRVRCIKLWGYDLPKKLKEEEKINDDQHYELILNKTYNVYALGFENGYIWYLICNENHTYYPLWHPSSLFSLIDGRISQYWMYSLYNNIDSDNAIFSFFEWFNNDQYFDNLIDGEEREVKIFQEYKQKMDLEFPNPEIKDKAEALEDEWMMCPFCIDAWKPLSKDGMVICPICKRIMHNPYFKISNERI